MMNEAGPGAGPLSPPPTPATAALRASFSPSQPRRRSPPLPPGSAAALVKVTLVLPARAYLGSPGATRDYLARVRPI